MSPHAVQQSLRIPHREQQLPQSPQLGQQVLQLAQSVQHLLQDPHAVQQFWHVSEPHPGQQLPHELDGTDGGVGFPKPFPVLLQE